MTESKTLKEQTMKELLQKANISDSESDYKYFGRRMIREIINKNLKEVQKIATELALTLDIISVNNKYDGYAREMSFMYTRFTLEIVSIKNSESDLWSIVRSNPEEFIVTNAEQG